jgi:hypothetical protein
MLGLRIACAVLVVAIAFTASPSILAQSGNTCITPQGQQCPVIPPGLPGAICFCPGPGNVPVQGIVK